MKKIEKQEKGKSFRPVDGEEAYPQNGFTESRSGLWEFLGKCFCRLQLRGRETVLYGGNGATAGKIQSAGTSYSHPKAPQNGVEGKPAEGIIPGSARRWS